MSSKSEKSFQQELFIWFYNSFPEYRIKSKKVKTPRCLLVHNYNNPRSKIQGAQLASMGLCRGMPDMILYLPKKGYHGLFLELKKQGEKPKTEQIEMINVLRDQGYKVEWSDNIDQAKRIIINYIS